MENILGFSLSRYGLEETFNAMIAATTIRDLILDSAELFYELVRQY